MSLKRDNRMPGRSVDYDFRVTPDKEKNVLKVALRRTWWITPVSMAIVLLVGVGIGSHHAQERANNATVSPAVAPQPAVTVTVRVPSPTVPAACTIAFKHLEDIQPDLDQLLNSSKTQVVIGSKAYTAIASRDTAAVNKALSDQYDLNRKTSHSTSSLQEERDKLMSELDQCKTALGR